VTAELIDCLPRATTLVLPDVGHMPNLEVPHQFNEALIEFLRRGVASHATNPRDAPRLS
jgi:pimeloyl-ACP methyl ester carboxylesterase